MDFHRAPTSYGQLALQRPPVIQPSHEFPMSTPVKMEKDDSEEEIINSAQSSGSSGSPENHSTGGVSSPLDDSPLDDHPHLRGAVPNTHVTSSPQRTPSTPTINGSPEAMVRVSPMGAPVGSHLSMNPTTPPRASLTAGMGALPTPPAALTGLSTNLASNATLFASLFGSALGAPNLADMANKSPEEQQQISTELQANILQLIQAVQAQAKAQQEEKVRQEEAERAAREAAQIAEFIQHELSHEQRKEMSDFLTKNPRVTVDDASILFTAKFGKQISSRVISTMKGEPLTPLPPSPPQSVPSVQTQTPMPQAPGWPSNVTHMVDMFKSNQIAIPSPASSPLGNKINHAFKNRNSAFPEIEQKISELFDEAEAEGRQLSSKVVRQKALEYADMLGIKNFNASKGWLLKLLARQNRKLGRSVDHLQKRKPFIRLSFGEKHEIAKYITQFPDKTYPEYARHFSELWNRTVTARQIITTKENTDKWLDEAYKGCEQTHYKFVDEGSEQDGPMVMKRKRSRVILTPDEREEISNFLADNSTDRPNSDAFSEMTFNQTAEIFARRWGKDVNRTHVASIMRLREKASQNSNANSNQLAIGSSQLGLGGFRKITSKPSALAAFGRSSHSPPTLLPQSQSHFHQHPYHQNQAHIGQKRAMPMSGLDLFNLNNLESTAGVIHGSGAPPTLNTSSSSASSIKTERVSSPVSVITPNSFVAKREKPDDECFDVSSYDDSKKQKIQCEKCPATFPSQAGLFQHILTAPGHRDEPSNNLDQ